MHIPPEDYAFLLEHDYAYVRTWVQTGEVPLAIDDLLPLLETYKKPITAWVWHNERHGKMMESKSERGLAIGYAEFYGQLDEGECS